MRRNWLLLGVALLAAALAFGAVACGGDDDEGDGDGGDGGATVVSVNLLEFRIVPDVASMPAGAVTFNVSNIGGDDHELVIIKTDLAPDALPTRDDGGVDEGGAGIEVIDKIEEFEAGGEESLTRDLEAGAYVLICNIVEEVAGTTGSHYQEGMTVAFEVTG